MNTIIKDNLSTLYYDKRINNSLIKKYSVYYLSTKVKKENIKNTSNVNKTNIPSNKPNEKIILEKELQSLKNKYSQQLNKTEEFKRKFREIRQMFLESQKEIENIKKRQEKEIQRENGRTKIKFMKDLLEFNDTFKTALTVSENYKRLKKEEDKLNVISSIRDSISMMQNSLKKIFNKYNIKEFTPKEEDKFDPNLHEIILEYNNRKKKNGTIGKVFTSGFKIDNITIRAARIGIINNNKKI